MLSTDSLYYYLSIISTNHGPCCYHIQMIFFRENKDIFLFVCFFSAAMKCKMNTQKLYLDNHCYKCIELELGACISPFSAAHPGLCHRSSSNCISLLPLFPAQAEVLLSLPRDIILAACLVPKASSQNLSCRRYPGGIPVKCLNNRIAPFDAEHQWLWHTPQRPIAHPVSVIFLFQSLATARGHMWR